MSPSTLFPRTSTEDSLENYGMIASSPLLSPIYCQVSSGIGTDLAFSLTNAKIILKFLSEGAKWHPVDHNSATMWLPCWQILK